MFEGQSPQEYFRLVLMTVVGQAYTSAGYELQDKPVKWAAGKFSFIKAFDNGLYGFIDYQLLSYINNEWSSGMPSRFQITLTRSDLFNPVLYSNHDLFVKRDLSALVVEDFGVPILPSAHHWWTFRNTEELGNALAEAGHLVVGYGLPWLAGDLDPNQP